MGVHTFLKGIRLKVNIIASLKFELPDYDVVVRYISHYTMNTLLKV